jgi:hypothetical protein
MSSNDSKTDLVLDLDALGEDDYDGEQPEYYDHARNVTYRSSGTYPVTPEAAAEYTNDPRDCWSRPGASSSESSGADDSDGSDGSNRSDKDDGSAFDGEAFVATEGRTVDGLRTALKTGEYDSADRLQAIANAEAADKGRKTAYDALERRARNLGIENDLSLPDDAEETDGGRTE